MRELLMSCTKKALHNDIKNIQDNNKNTLNSKKQNKRESEK